MSTPFTRHAYGRKPVEAERGAGQEGLSHSEVRAGAPMTANVVPKRTARVESDGSMAC